MYNTMYNTVTDYETGDVVFMQVVPAFLVLPAVEVLAPVVSDENTMYEAMAEALGFGPGLERFDGISAHFGSD